VSVNLVDEHGRAVEAPVKTEVFATGVASEMEVPMPEGTENLEEKAPLAKAFESGRWLMPRPGLYLVRDGELPVEIPGASMEQGMVLAGRALEKWGKKPWALVAVKEMIGALPEVEAQKVVARAAKAAKKGGGK